MTEDKIHSPNVTGLPGNGVIILTTKADKPYYLKGSDEAVYLYVQIRSGEAPSAVKRVPLNISLVLDRSGSMEGNKLVYAKKAISFVVDQLSADDYLSVVNYDDYIEVTSPSQLVKNKEALKRQVEKIDSRGATNLSGGALEGYKQVKSTRKSGFVNRVLLLTDGLANEGITEPSKINQLVTGKYLEENIALSTFGVGADYNEDLLTAMAEAGKGNYYFINTPDKIPGIFAKELEGLLSVLAQNAIYSIEFPAGLVCDKVYGHQAEIKNNKVIVRLNDIYAKDEKAVLIKLKPSQSVREQMEFKSRLTYTDVESFRETIVSQVTQVTLSSSKEEVKQHTDASVEEMIALFEAAEAFDKVMELVDKGSYEDAKKVSAEIIKKLQEEQKKKPSVKLKQQEQQLSEYEKGIDDAASMSDLELNLYQKSNKFNNYERKKMK